MRRHAPENRAQRLRSTVEALPRRTKVAMLRGIVRNRIVVGAYADPRTGGVCPMLAAHRNGGRTNFASFARAWDVFTSARRPRLATRHELGVLRSYLEFSLLHDEHGEGSIAAVAESIRAEREGDSVAEEEDRTPPIEVPSPGADDHIRVRPGDRAPREQPAVDGEGPVVASPAPTAR